MLANSVCPEDGEDATDLFRRDADGKVVLQQNQLYAMLAAAKTFINSKIIIDDIRYNLSLTLAEPTEVYKRPYRKEGEPKVRKHESIPIGDKVRLRMYVPDLVSASDIHQLFEAAGSYVGLSPYGHRFGFGRFGVLTVAEAEPVPVAVEVRQGPPPAETDEWVPGAKK